MLDYNKEMLIEDMGRACDQWGVGCTRQGLEANLNAWARNKERLVTLLRRHPNWNERAMGVVFTTSEHRDFNGEKYRQKLYTLLYCFYPETMFNIDAVHRLIPESANDKPDYNALRTYRTLTHEILNSYVKGSRADRELVEVLQESAFTSEVTKNFKEGMKTSRIVNALIEPAINKDNPEILSFYNKTFARLADALNPMTITKYTILSVHPADFLTMSNGTGWESCHRLDKGGWRGGCLSYITDDVSMILYTVSPSYNGDEYFYEPKINRQIYCLGEDNRLLQSRLYPQNESDDHTSSDNFRANVQEILAACLDIPNLWVKSSADPDEFFKEGRYNKAYDDWNYPDQWYVTVSYPKDTKPSEYRTPIGGLGYCLDCGEPLDDDEPDHIYCYKCRDWICQRCGCIVGNEDYGHWIDGVFYCEDCVFYCDYHHCYEPIAWQSEEDCNLCQEAFDNNYFVCEECDTVTPLDRMVIAGGRNLCVHCAADLAEEEIA